MALCAIIALPERTILHLPWCTCVVDSEVTSNIIITQYVIIGNNTKIIVPGCTNKKTSETII